MRIDHLCVCTTNPQTNSCVHLYMCLCLCVCWGTGHLNSLDYHVCVRATEGYCGIMYSPTGAESFLLTGRTDANITVLERENLVSGSFLGKCE